MGDASVQPATRFTYASAVDCGCSKEARYKASICSASRSVRAANSFSRARLDSRPSSWRRNRWEELDLVGWHIGDFLNAPRESILGLDVKILGARADVIRERLVIRAVVHPDESTSGTQAESHESRITDHNSLQSFQLGDTELA